MSDTSKQKQQQANPTPDDATVKPAADTGDRELSDADLDKVSGGANSTPLPSVRPGVRSL